MLSETMLPTRGRLAGFIAISIALHLLTALGIGPLNLSARHIGGDPFPSELHATLAPGEPGHDTPAFPPAASAGETATESAHPLSPGGKPAQPGTAADEPGLALPALEKWYTAREVDVRAQPLTEVNLRYPAELRSQAVIGRVQLLLFIDERGVVRKMQIAASEPGGLFDEAAKQTWEEVRFSPAIKNGVPVKSQKLLEVTYQPGLITSSVDSERLDQRPGQGKYHFLGGA